MLDSTTLTIFIIAAMALLLTPGPAVLYIIARSIDQGRVAGVVSVIGINVGALFHIGAAAFGISALLVSSSLAFQVVKYLGAIYLIYLGVRTLLAPPAERANTAVRPQPLGQIFRQGIIVNLLNPKTALFFFAFLPQFVDPARGSAATQIVLLGGIFVGLAVLSDGLYALLAGTLGKWLKRSNRFLRAQRRISGSIYIILGVATAVSGSHSK